MASRNNKSKSPIPQKKTIPRQQIKPKPTFSYNKTVDYDSIFNQEEYQPFPYPDKPRIQLSQQQVTNMSVEQILALAQRRSLKQKSPVPQQQYSPQPPPVVYNQQINQPPQYSQPPQPYLCQPIQNYDQMIEQKVFSYLQQNFPQSHPKPTLAQQPSINEDPQLKKLLDSQHDEIVKLKRLLESKDLHEETLRKQIDQFDSQVTAKVQQIQRQYQEALSQVEFLKEQNQSLKEQLKESQQIIQELEQQPNSDQVISALKGDCLRMQDEVQKAIKIHQANKLLQDKIKDLQTQVELNSDQSQLQSEYNQLCQEVKQLRSEGEINVNKINSLQLVKSQLEVNVKQLQDQISQLNKTSGDQVQAQLQLVKAQMQTKSEDHAIVVNTYKQQVEEYDAQIRDLKTELAMKQSELEMASSECIDLQQQIKSFKAGLEKSLKDGQQQQSQEVAKLVKERDTLKSQVDGLTQQVVKDCEQIESAKSEAIQAKQKEQRAHAEVAGLKQMIQTMSMQMAEQMNAKK